MGLNLEGQQCFYDSIVAQGRTERNSHLCDIPSGADVDRHRLSEDATVEAEHCLQDVSRNEITLAVHESIDEQPN